MKKIVIVSNLKIIDKILNYTDAFIFGIKDLSINLPVTYVLEELIEIINYLNQNKKEVFISLNKNMHNSDLVYLKEILVKLNDLNIKGVLYYDISLVNLKDKLNLNYDLVWSQEHLTNNYFTCNYWKTKGIDYTMLSAEITLDEIINIRKNTNQKLIVPIFGYLPMFASRRHLVKNYLTTFNIIDDSSINYIYKENNTYPIIDSNLGSVVYTSKVLNGLSESLILKENNIDYILLNSFNIVDNKFIEVLKCFNDVNDNNKIDLENKINRLLDNNTSKYFLYEETIYRVKKDG